LIRKREQTSSIKANAKRLHLAFLSVKQLPLIFYMKRGIASENGAADAKFSVRGLEKADRRRAKPPRAGRSDL
jgi:hypothetical protein